MRAMSRTEGVIDKHVAERGERFGKGVIVLLFTGMKTEILKQQDIAWNHFGYQLSTAGPMQSGANMTSFPSRRPRRFATGARLYFGSNDPFGRPRCEQRMTFAPSSTTRLIVGRVERMRVSSVICRDSSSGTLKSARIITRFPRSCTSSMVFL